MDFMIKETVQIKITNELRDNAMKLIDNTINEVMSIHGETLPSRDVTKIRNLTLDQVNVNVTSRANLKTLWVINVEESLPIIVEKELGIPELGELVPRNGVDGMYKMKPNLTWTFSRDNSKDGGVDKNTFEDTVIEMLFEDIETAAFYGALSYVGDVNAY